jgi:hypothetical protein
LTVDRHRSPRGGIEDLAGKKGIAQNVGTNLPVPVRGDDAAEIALTVGISWNRDLRLLMICVSRNCSKLKKKDGAVWPGGIHNTRDITRYIALESR